MQRTPTSISTSSSVTNPESCPFCPIKDREILADHPLAAAITDSFPLTQGHTLIVPRRHVASFFELTSDERLAMVGLLDEAKAALDRQHAPDGYNIGINDGVAAGQTVMHVHVHLIPRYRGDIDDPRGGVRWIFPQRADYWKR
jgi:diadenosine tetraphosphate (Ap4A) HIT family hydrolase